MGKKVENRRREKTGKVVIITCIIFVLLLIPLYVIGHYAHPSVDDYYYGTDTVKVWKSTHSFWETCKMSAKQTKQVYKDWQGNFSGIFLMGLQPGIFGEKNYIWTTIIILTTFVMANLYFYWQLMIKFLKKDRKQIFLISMVITMTALQYAYMPVDSFYWYNGGIYYTFFYSLSLILFGNILWKWRRKGIKTSCITFITAILAFLIGGSNYSTALVSVIILFIINGFDIISYKKSKTDKNFLEQVNFYPLCLRLSNTKELMFDSLYAKYTRIRIIENSIILVFLTAGFLISVLAPGNEIRQASVGGSNSVIKAIMLSFCYAGYNVASATTLPVFCVWLMLFPLLWNLLPEQEQWEKDCQCKKRIIMWGEIVLLFCVFAAQGAPVFYAQGIRIPYRLMNIIYFSYFTFALLVWIILLKAIKESEMVKKAMKKYRMLDEKIRKYHTKIYYVAVSMLLLLAVIGNIKIQENETEMGKVEIEGLPMTAEAVYSLATGEAKNYSNEVDKRVALYENENLKTIKVNAFEYRPYLLYHSDITTDRKHWRNQHVSKFYNKQYVVLKKEK